MKRVAFYDPTTGLFHPKAISLTVSDDEAVKLNTPPGYAPIEHPPGSEFDQVGQRVAIERFDEGEAPTAEHVVDHQPPQPSADHEWNSAARRWRLSSNAQARQTADLEARIQIQHIERNVQPRALREAVMGTEGARERLIALDAQIAELRKSLI